MIDSPLSPSSDLSQISPCNIKGLSVMEVMRTENMITQVKINYLNISTASSAIIVWRREKRICSLILGQIF